MSGVGEVSGHDLRHAILALRKGMAGATEQKPVVGFSAYSESTPVPAALNHAGQGGEL